MPAWANEDHTAVILDNGAIAPADEKNRDYRKLVASGAIAEYSAPAVTSEDVDEEWTRRVFTEFPFNGETFHADRDSVDNILGSVSWAQDAIANNVQAGNYYWQADDPDNPGQGDLPFAWKSKSNGLIPMDAPTVVAFGKAAAKWKQDHFIAARALKAMDPIPSDYKDDSYWP